MSSSSQDPPKRPSLTPAVHGGEPTRFAHDALTLPIIQTATYTFENTAELVAYMEGHREREEYGRYGNPTVRVLEERIAALECAEDAVMFSSGMAAMTSAILALVGKDQHVVLFNDCYRRTRQFVTTFLSRFGVRHTLLAGGDLDGLAKAIESDTKLVISEAPTRTSAWPSCCNWWAWTRPPPRAGRTSFPAASASASALRARWR
jgi:cystathionine gamma-synthase